MKRINSLDPDKMSDEQLKVYNKIISGPRGKFGGPFPVLLRLPKAADLIQELGSWLRFESKMPSHLREIVILMTAHQWNCKIEWEAHAIIAEREGVSRDLIDSIKFNKISNNVSERELAVIKFCNELENNKFISDSTYSSTVDILGLDTTIEVTIILGYYSMLSMILNVFEK
jgi:4-carboxymuconolactone decarboxylase